MSEQIALALARERMAAGDVASADDLLTDALRASPGNPDLLYLRAIVAGRRGYHAVAVDMLGRVTEAAPGMSLAWLALGHAHMRLQAFADAAEAYARAAALEPKAADIHFNLGVAHWRMGDPATAAPDFYRAWLRDPGMADAARACVAALGALASQDARTGGCRKEKERAPTPGTSTSVAIIVCSIDDAKASRILATYDRAFAGVPHEVLVIRDARSLAEAYNRGIEQSSGEIVLLSHDDIEFPAPAFAPTLLHHLRNHDVVGVVGATRVTGPVPVWAGHPHLRGWITHHAPGDATWRVGLLHPAPVAGGVMVLDGVMLAARREVFERVRFDAETFDGFHGYDVDWSYRAAQAGFRLAAAGDLQVVHASRGRYDATWQRYAERFCTKHGIVASEPAPPPYYETPLASEREVRAFFDRLIDLAREESSA